MGKTARKNKVYSAEFKIGVIMDMRKHRLGYREAARKYDLTVTSETSAANIVQRWERIYLEEDIMKKDEAEPVLPVAKKADRRNLTKRFKKI